MTKARDIASASPAPSTVSATEIGYLDGVTSAIQTQIDGKQAANANVSTTELGYLDGVTSAIQTQLDGKTAKSTLTTTGDIYYASSANTPARLGIGSTGNVLTVASGIPSWAAPAGGGKVLQVVSTSYTTDKTISSSTYTDTDLTLSITPTLSTSKILVLVGQGIKLNGSSNNFGLGYAQLLRGSTVLLTDFTAVIQAAFNVNGQTGVQMYIGASYLDNPATTSSTTYKTQIKTGSGVGAVVAQYNTTPSTLTLMEIGA